MRGGINSHLRENGFLRRHRSGPTRAERGSNCLKNRTPARKLLIGITHADLYQETLQRDNRSPNVSYRILRTRRIQVTPCKKPCAFYRDRPIQLPTIRPFEYSRVWDYLPSCATCSLTILLKEAHHWINAPQRREDHEGTPPETNLYDTPICLGSCAQRPVAESPVSL